MDYDENSDEEEEEDELPASRSKDCDTAESVASLVASNGVGSNHTTSFSALKTSISTTATASISTSPATEKNATESDSPKKNLNDMQPKLDGDEDKKCNSLKSNCVAKGTDADASVNSKESETTSQQTRTVKPVVTGDVDDNKSSEEINADDETTAEESESPVPESAPKLIHNGDVAAVKCFTDTTSVEGDIGEEVSAQDASTESDISPEADTVKREVTSVQQEKKRERNEDSDDTSGNKSNSAAIAVVKDTQAADNNKCSQTPEQDEEHTKTANVDNSAASNGVQEGEHVRKRPRLSVD